MEFGATSPADPSKLANALQLDHSVQQDGQEFMKLFLSLLERSFSQQPNISTIVQQLFRGKSGYETVCQGCGKPSKSSQRVENFYELDVPVRGFTSLESSLASLLASELLCGENKYYCERCMTKSDATRRLCLHVLPPILCLSLQRFVFDFVRMDRVKVSDTFSFPLELTMNATDGSSSAATQYDLHAVLLHKGTSASQGHYVAHINNNGRWWRFDDSAVSEMTTGPFNASDHGGGASKQQVMKSPLAVRGRGGRRGGRGGKGGMMKKKRALITDSSVNPTDIRIDLSDSDYDPSTRKTGDHAIEMVAQEPEAPTSKITSSNAYLLVYKQRGVDLPHVDLDEEVVGMLSSARETYLREHEINVIKYQESKQALVKQREEQQGLVRSIFEMMPPDADDVGRCIPTEWLMRWADADSINCVEVAPIDTSTLLCEHHKLSPLKFSTSGKRVSSRAWEQLNALYKGGPELTPLDACTSCLIQRLEGMAQAEDSQGQRDKYLAMAARLEKAVLARGAGGMEEDGRDVHGASEMHGEPEYYVSRVWLNSWVKRGGRSMGNTSPTAALVCPHRGLIPEPPDRLSKRIGVTADFWAFLRQSWILAESEKNIQIKDNKQKAKDEEEEEETEVVCLIDNENESMDHSFLTEFPIQSTEECAVCRVHLSQAAELASEIMERRVVERSSLAHLLDSSTARLASLELGATYHLIPKAFMEHWRSYMHQGKVARSSNVGGTAAIHIQPPDLKAYMSQVMCSCHADELGAPVPSVIMRRNRWVMLDDATAIFEIISSEDWRSFTTFYGGGRDGDDDGLSLPAEEKGILVLLGPGRNTEGEMAEGGERKQWQTFLDDGATIGGTLPDQDVIGDDYQPVGRLRHVHQDRAVLIPTPAVCSQALQAADEEAKTAKLAYTDAEVIVEMVGDDEAMHIVSGNPAVPVQAPAVERKSKRARKGRAPITVAATMPLSDLKLRIFEAIGVHPRNARIFLRGRELTEAHFSLAQYEVFPGDELKIVNTKEFDPDDYASLFPADSPASKKRPRQTEQGFTGTALTGK